jgi:GTPase SAR1 family protein
MPSSTTSADMADRHGFGASEPVAIPDRASTRRSAAQQLLRTGRRAATAYGRDDLAARLAALDDQVADPTVTVVVLGEFKAGKSSLVNALLGVTTCPVDADIATEVPTVLRYASEPFANGVRRERDLGDGHAAATSTGPASLVPIAPDDVADVIATQGSEWRLVEVGVPRRLLQDGLVLIDTPGTGGLDARHLADALGVLAMADAVLFAVDAANELSGPALALLGQVAELCPTIVVVATKADLYHHVPQILEANRGHLARADLAVSTIVTSAELRQLALATGDHGVEAESGFTELTATLLGFTARADDLAARRAARAVADVAEQIRRAFIAEAAALADPQQPAPAAAPPSTRSTWQQILVDDSTDLHADLDHQLRRRSRALIAEAEEALGAGDPAELWPELSAWLEERAAADVVATFAMVRERSLTMAERIAERFEQTDGAGRPVDDVALDELGRKVLAALPERASFEAEATSRTSTGLNALRSSFYGFLMFSTLGTLVGVAAAPAALVLGLVIGSKTVRDDRSRSQQQRRIVAKGAIRTYVDEVAFTSGKEARDAVRNVQRALRDHFTELAAEQQRSAAGATAAAQRASATAASQRTQRALDVAAELERLDELTRRAQALAESGPASSDLSDAQASDRAVSR